MKRSNNPQRKTDMKTFLHEKDFKSLKDILHYTITGSIVEINYKWVVKGVRCQVKHSSKELFAGEYNEIKFQLSLEPIGEGLALKVSTEFQRPCLGYMCEFSCVKINFEETNIVSNLIRDSKKSDRIFKDFLKKGDLSDKDLFHGDNLIVLCKINADLYRSKLTDAIWANTEETWDLTTKATEAYESLFNSGSYYDTILVVEGKKFCVHHCVLCSRSSFFSQLLKPYSTKEIALVELTDVNSKMMSDILKYIYSGKIGSYQDIELCDLIRVAHKLKLTELLTFCENRLRKEVTVDNHKEILNLAKQCNLERLNKTVIKYVAANFGEFRRPDFEALAHIDPNSVVNVLDEISCHYSLVRK